MANRSQIYVFGVVVALFFFVCVCGDARGAQQEHKVS